MNLAYRLVWNESTQSFVTAPECARSRTKGGRSSKRSAAVFAVASALVMAGLGGVSCKVGATPTGGTVISGSASVTQKGAAGATTTTIQQNSPTLSMSWNSFNTSAGETVNFLQPTATSVAVNRILGTDGTQFLGTLNANGIVYVINPNGVLFGQGAQVNVGGLVASTLDISDS
jgi:filamentous hemagglutinin family protein